MHHKIVTNVNAVNTKIPNNNGLVAKKQSDLDKQSFEKKIKEDDTKARNGRGLVKKTGYNTKVIEIENKTPIITGSVSTAALSTKAVKIKN